MLGAISHTVPLLTVLDYYDHTCMFALKSRPFLGIQRLLWGLAQEMSRLRHNVLFGGTQSRRSAGKDSHISWRSISSTQRRCALELKCSAAAESLCGLVIRGKLWARFVPSLWMPAPLGAQQCHRAPAPGSGHS